MIKKCYLVVLLALMCFGCSGSSNDDLATILESISSVDIEVSNSGFIQIHRESLWDSVIISMAYLGSEEIVSLLDLSDESVSLLENELISSEWPGIFFVKDNKIVSYSQIKQSIEIQFPGSLIVKWPKNEINYLVDPKSHFKLKLSLK